MQLEHTHAGEPTYLAYTGLNCRHPACYLAYVEYKERLGERKISGAFKDMRLKENRQEAITAEFVERLKNDRELAGQLIPVLAGIAEPVRQPEPESEPAPTTDTPVAEKPLRALAAAPVTLLGCLAELADNDGAISMLDVTSHAKEMAARLGLEALAFTSQIHALIESHQLLMGITMVRGKPVSVYRLGDKAAA